jgi:hypothetical protein
MNPIGVNLGFNDAEVIFAGALRNMNATCVCAWPEDRLLIGFAITFPGISAQFGILLRLAHDNLHAKELRKCTVKGYFVEPFPFWLRVGADDNFQMARVE